MHQLNARTFKRWHAGSRDICFIARWLDPTWSSQAVACIEEHVHEVHQMNHCGTVMHHENATLLRPDPHGNRLLELCTLENR